jgi:nicotinamidase/pyrazinamidase
MQNDFIDGPLAMTQFPANQDPQTRIPIINSLVNNAEFDLVVYTQDWHPKDHLSFYDNYISHELTCINREVT